jgi:23S rRNA pseudouridine1911/1915/1917 synthase
MSPPALAAPAVLAVDHRVVVVDKPAGITSEDTARLLGRRLVHRIDRGTSGLLLLADDARTVQRMQRLLAAAQVTRTYLALANGRVSAGVVDRAIVDDRGDGRRGSIEPETSEPGSAVVGKPARTVVDVVVARDHASLVRARLVTGRTHQVRIHLADTGHPLVGDDVYGDRAADDDARAPRLMLHAWKLAFVHPNSHAPVAFCAPPPPAFAAVVDDVLGPGAFAMLDERT